MMTLVSVWRYDDGSWIVAGSKKDKKGRVGDPVFLFKKGRELVGWTTREYEHLGSWIGGRIAIVDQPPPVHEPSPYDGLVVSITPDFYSHERLLDVVVYVGPRWREKLQLLLDQQGNVVDETWPNTVTGLAQSLGHLEQAFELWAQFVQRTKNASKGEP